MFRVCHFTSVHPASDGRIFHKECVSLAKAGYEVYLVAPNAKDEIIEGVHIVGVQVNNGNRFYRILLAANAICKKALSLDADIYHFHDPELLRFVSCLKKKRKIVIYDMHEDYPVNILTKNWIPLFLRKYISSLYLKYETKMLKKLDAVVVVTPQMKKRLQALTEVEIITNYPLYEEPETRKVDYLERENILSFAGTISEIRLHENLIRAIEGINNVQYYLAGRRTPYLDKLKHLSGWKKVVYLGLISQKEVEELYVKTKIGIIIEDYGEVNYGDEGSMGVTKLFDYMKFSIPFICTDFEYHKEIVDKYHCAIAVNPRNLNEITDAILYLLSHPEEAKKMGKNGHEAYVAYYNWASQEKILIDLYSRLEEHEKQVKV